MKKTTFYLVQGALIAAIYAALTYVAGLMGIAYLGIQFRLSEALTILPVFTPAATVGLTIGCALGNLASPFGLVDIICGTAATLVATLVTRAVRKIQVGGFPILAPLAPVLANALIVGAEITVLSPEASVVAFLYSALTVGVGELVVCYGLGTPLYYLCKKYEQKLFYIR